MDDWAVNLDPDDGASCATLIFALPSIVSALSPNKQVLLPFLHVLLGWADNATASHTHPAYGQRQQSTWLVVGRGGPGAALRALHTAIGCTVDRIVAAAAAAADDDGDSGGDGDGDDEWASLLSSAVSKIIVAVQVVKSPIAPHNPIFHTKTLTPEILF
jgi:hypothetical protein